LFPFCGARSDGTTLLVVDLAAKRNCNWRTGIGFSLFSRDGTARV
jgi:hypothetical protein